MILRELFVSLGLDVDEASFAKGQLAANLVTAGLSKLVEIGKDTIHAFVENAKAALEYGDKVQKTSQSIGIATGALQELHYAGSLAGLSAEEMSGSIGLLSRKMQAAKEGGEDTAKAFKGITFKEGGKLKSADQVLGSIADKFKTMPDGAEKTALAMELFGRAGKQMIPLLNKGAEELESVRKEARELGLVMSGEATAAAEELNDNLERLHAVSQGLWRGAITPLLPAINELVARFLKWKKENAEIIKSRIQWVIGNLIKGVHLLADAFDFVIRNATAIKFLLGTAGLTMVVIGLATAMSTLSWASVKAALATARAWLAAAAPFIAIAALVAGFLLIFDDIRTFQQGGDSLYGRFKKEIDSWLEPKEDDPWFVKALKYFVELIRDAIQVLLEFDEATGRTRASTIDKRAATSKPEMQRQTDNVTLEAARVRARQGLPMTGAAKAALKRSGVSEQAFVTQYSAEVRPGGSGGGGAVVHAPVNITVTQQPGESGEALAGRITETIDLHWNSQLMTAGAGVTR